MSQNLFKAHILNEQGLEKAKHIATQFGYFLQKIEDAVGETGVGISREMSLVRTKLEEACFFAKKAMAMKSENQE